MRDASARGRRAEGEGQDGGEVDGRAVEGDEPDAEDLVNGDVKDACGFVERYRRAEQSK